MTNKTQQVRRVLLAVTETSPVEKLWQALVDCVAGGHAEVITVFVSDDRWRRAASLPFTREISRLSGVHADFTRRRAEHIDEDAVERARERIGELAASKGLELVFELLPEHETTRVREVVRMEQDVLIAPSVLEGRPVFTELARLNRRIMLIDVEERENACRTGR